jgi:hypothetical protein
MCLLTLNINIFNSLFEVNDPRDTSSLYILEVWALKDQRNVNGCKVIEDFVFRANIWNCLLQMTINFATKPLNMIKKWLRAVLSGR